MTKEESLMAKGVAIVFMLFHHLYFSADIVSSYAGGASVSFTPFDSSLVYVVCQSFKVCVAIFVFISAYGISAQETLDFGGSVSGRAVRRLIKLLFNFWIVFVFAQLIGYLLGTHTTSLVYFQDGFLRGFFYLIVDACGLASVFGTPSFNVTWWYMSYAILLIFFVPLLVKIHQVIGGASLFALSILFCLMLGQDLSLPFWWWLPTAALGVWCSRARLYSRLCSIELPGKVLVACGFPLMMLLLLVFRVKLGYFFLIDAVFALVVCIWVCQLSDIGLISFMLKRLGIHSMNIFLIHSFIFKYFFSGVIYSFRHFILIFLALLVSSYTCSWLIEKFKSAIHYSEIVKRASLSICHWVD